MNIMNEYVKITKKFITDYSRLIMNNRFNRRISDEFVDTYIQTRYYELDEKINRNELKKEIVKSMEEKKKLLITENPEEKSNIEILAMFYNYILYFDFVINIKDKEQIINNIYEKRRKLLKKEDEDFTKLLSNLEEEHVKEVQELLNKLESNVFYLESKKILDELEIQEVDLKYNIKFSPLYSNFAIERAFTTGNTNEDKLFVLYHLLGMKIINDIIQGKMKKLYIVTLVDTMIKKKQKLKRLLEIIDNPYMQEKICLKLNYKEFLENKSNISELIQKGFKIAIVIDDTFELNTAELRKLEIFEIVLVNEKHKYYNDINLLKNVIKRNDE